MNSSGSASIFPSVRQGQGWGQLQDGRMSGGSGRVHECGYCCPSFFLGCSWLCTAGLLSVQLCTTFLFFLICSILTGCHPGQERRSAYLGSEPRNGGYVPPHALDSAGPDLCLVGRASRVSAPRESGLGRDCVRILFLLLLSVAGSWLHTVCFSVSKMDESH